MEYQEANSRLVIPHSNDQSMIGSYSVTLRSEVDTLAPGGTERVKLFVEETIEVKVLPCIVNTFAADLRINDLSYHLGDDGRTLGPYSFVQTPGCDYKETVTVQGLPEWITHNEADKTFTIPNTND